MKTLKIYFALLLFVTSSLAFAQSNSFDREIAPWHKKITMQCGMLKKQPVNAEQILENLNQLESELKVFTDKYLDNPPQEYAKDPNWKSYFQTLADHIVVVKERVEKKQFDKASIYCPNFCKLFGHIHKINGTTDFTDIVFSWRMEVKNTNDMFIVSNVNGVKTNLVVVENIYKQVIKYKSMRNDKNIDSIFKPLEDDYLTWLNAIKSGDKNKITISFKKFMDDFAKPYMASF